MASNSKNTHTSSSSHQSSSTQKSSASSYSANKSSGQSGQHKQPSIASTANEPNHTNDFWRVKIKYYFNEILDCNDDGKVNSDDIRIIIKFYKDIKKLSDHSSKYLDFKNFLEKWKTNMLAGKDHLTEQDFQKYCENLRSHLLHKKEWPNDMRNYIDSLFNLLDDDSDNYINLKDYLSIAINDDDKSCRNDAWKLVSGSASEDSYKLSKESFDKLCKEFLTSTNQKPLGNWIFGTFDYKNYEKNKEKEKEAKEKFLKEMKEKERDLMERIAKETAKHEAREQSKDQNKSGLNSVEKDALR